MWCNEAIYTDKYTGYQQLVYITYEKNLYTAYKRSVLESNNQARILMTSAYPTRLWCLPDRFPELVTDYPPPTEKQVERILREHPFGCSVDKLRIAMFDLAVSVPRYTRTLAHYAAHHTNMQVAWTNYEEFIAGLESLRDTLYKVEQATTNVEPAPDVDNFDDIEL